MIWGLIYLLIGWGIVGFFIGSCHVKGGWSWEIFHNSLTEEPFACLFWLVASVLWFPIAAYIVIRPWISR